MALPFVKMHGCGNDYVFMDAGLLEGWELPAAAARDLAILVSDRHTGIGSDGLILLEGGDAEPVRMRMYNADGSEGRLCLNGLRCAALYAYDRADALGTEFTIGTAAGPRAVRIRPERPGHAFVTVDAGAPDFRRAAIPAGGAGDELRDERFPLPGGGDAPGDGVSVGNPHLVLWLPDREAVATVDLPALGRPLELDATRFPEGVNVHVAATVAGDRIAMRSWERGSGLTRACGSGAVAVFAAARRGKRCDPGAEVCMPGGGVRLREEPDGRLILTGPAVEVFHGIWPQ